MMKSTIKIAVLGGTGKSGKYLVHELLQQGYSIRLLLRSPENFHIDNPLIEIVKGDARDAQSLLTLVKDCQAVLSTLGQPKGEATIFSTATRNVLQAMKDSGVKRYIVTTGLSVDTDADRKSEKTQAGTDWMKQHYPETTSDKQREYELLKNSTIDWTMVRLPMIELTDTKVPIHVSLEDCPGDKISATSLSHFLLQQLKDDRYIQQAPFIANV